MTRLCLEPLEFRWLPSAVPLVVAPNETIDQAQDLGTLNASVQALGAIGNGADGAADVTWYHFNLAEASRVELNVSTPAGNPPFASVLSLFNNDPQDWSDPYDADGHRLLAQVESGTTTGVADDVEDLGPGDYYVAISGAGNLDFSPVIAGSGYAGATGNYELTIDTSDLGLENDGPTILGANPAPGAVISAAPLAIRIEMSDGLDPNTIVAGQTVQLFSTPNGSLAESAGEPIALASVNFSSTANELQLFPLAPLAPGNYEVWLAGNSSTDQAVLADTNGLELGENAANPTGSDETLSFTVDGIDGIAGATSSDDTVATAYDLGDVTGAGVVQVSGAIGDDPFFDPNLSPDPSNPEPQFVPANQVDLYHFDIIGPGRYAVLAEVFAGRIGSPLDPGVSLFEYDPTNGSLIFIAGNNNTLDGTIGTDGSVPLLLDPALSAGLTAGDYYLAVADGPNTPSPIEGQVPGSAGIFNPNQPGSAQLGYSTGSYVLNVLVQPAPSPPQVVSSSPAAGQVLDQPPTQLTIQFSEEMNFQQLDFEAFNTSYENSITQVFVESSNGTKYYPRFVSYDRATNQATFLMLDGLLDGSYALHLSGPGGLTDLGGNSIVANDPSGDFVIPFQVAGTQSGISGNMTDGYTINASAGEGAPRDLGVLFPDQLQAGVTILRGTAEGSNPHIGSTADDYVFQILQSQTYAFQLSGDNLPPGLQVNLTDAAGDSLPLNVSSDGGVFFGALSAGTYMISVAGWTQGPVAPVSYNLTINLNGTQQDAPALLDGPAPALQLHFDGALGTAGGVPSIGTSGSASGLGSPPTSGAVAFAYAPLSTAGSLTSLGVGALGGVEIEATSIASESSDVAATPVQVTLNVQPTPVFTSLVSLITMTQVMTLNPSGSGPEPASRSDETTTEATGDPMIVLASQASILAETPRVPEPLMPGVIDPPRHAGNALAQATAAEEPAVSNSAELSFPPDRNIGERIEEERVAEVWATQFVMIGILFSAFRARRAIWDLRWRRGARSESVRASVTNGPNSTAGIPTVSWPHVAQGQTQPRRMGKLVPPARSFRSSDAR